MLLTIKMLSRCNVQDAVDVQKPEDLLHRLQQLQQDSLLQNERLAQATAAADSLRGGLRCHRFSFAECPASCNLSVQHQCSLSGVTSLLLAGW
jgi:hypothetical protein